MLGVVRVRPCRDDGAIREDIVQIGRTHRAGVAEEIDLDRRWTVRDDSWALSRRQAVQFEQNVDIGCMYPISGVLIRKPR